MNTHTVIISVGSNIGDKLDNCRHGIDSLLDSGKATLAKASRFYRTSPVDYQDQDWFVNAAVQVKTTLDPSDLLTTLQAIQQRMVEADLSRRTINDHVARIKRMFKWAVAQELIPATSFHQWHGQRVTLARTFVAICGPAVPKRRCREMA